MAELPDVRPTEVVILGAGIVGEIATKAAIGLGASVKVFDNSLSKIRRLHTHYRQQSSYIYHRPKRIKKKPKKSRCSNWRITKIKCSSNCNRRNGKIDEKGTVIIDLTIDYGNCIETTEITTHEDPVIIKHDILHCGLPNMTSRMPRTTTKAISNFFLSYLLNYDEEGGFENVLLKKKRNETVSLYVQRKTHQKSNLRQV